MEVINGKPLKPIDNNEAILDRFRNWISGFVKRTGGSNDEATKGQPEGQGEAITQKKDDRNDSILLQNFAWIENEGLLRDEGVLFGIAGSPMEEKVAAIREYYDRKRLISEAAISNAQEVIGVASIRVVEFRRKISEADAKLGVIGGVTSNIVPTYLFRNLMGLALIVIGCIGSYYIIEKYLADDFGKVGALGVFAFGLFAQFKPLSSWLKHDEEEVSNKWQRIKNTLLEIGTTVAVTVFVGYHIYVQSAKFGEAFFTSLFLFFLFLFCGRLILALINNISAELKNYRQSRNELKTKENDLISIRDEIKNLNETVNKEQEKISQFQSQIDMEKKNIQDYPGLSRTKMEIFKSEYNLARKFSNTVESDKTDMSNN